MIRIILTLIYTSLVLFIDKVRFFSPDKVHAVFHAALKLLEMILVDFIPQHKLGKAEVTHAVNHTLPALIQRTGETVS